MKYQSLQLSKKICDWLIFKVYISRVLYSLMIPYPCDCSQYFFSIWPSMANKISVNEGSDQQCRSNHSWVNTISKFLRNFCRHRQYNSRLQKIFNWRLAGNQPNLGDTDPQSTHSCGTVHITTEDR